MSRLALHWQILIGMIAGTLLGVGLNLGASTRSISLQADLPAGVQSVSIEDTADQTTIQYVDKAGDSVQRIVNPLAKGDSTFRTIDELAKTDAVAADLYHSYGQSTAKKWGGWFKKLGGLFLRMLQMVAVPLIITSLLTGILGLGGADGVGRMFRRTILYYLATSMLAITTGLVVVNIVRPGLTGNAIAANRVEAKEAASLGEILFQQLEAMIPSNPIGALVEPNFLSIIAFTIAFGLFTLSVGGATGQRVENAAKAGFDVMMAMTTAIIKLAPAGVFFLIAYVTATQGAGVFKSLGWYVLAVTIALAIHACITLPLILKFVAKQSPIAFAKAMTPALLTAFSSASSNGTLPLTMSSVENRAGISNETGSFVLPLGATINMDGTALYEAIAVLFIAQLHYGQNLPLTQQIIVAITALLASVGAAGIPHAGLVMMVIILQAVGLPVEMQGIILAVDRVLDMARTSVNVWSDSCGCAVVERLENGK
ncbi:dicarboxylate/amino acid:cation symporter [Rubripirellula reticaptiva]|uniref:Proton glutamate symport protein n=1 Tax=Rubripirellula reticaptiva TaxID=2528013 RepID=A0A5C6F7J6_9BACT|nr:dicarboxylate/amino acid:cation symporter [Rubripirellula reticaptiva]TWU55749.1 Proton glutamate symport protein [Rubripirellula reticaptiva]